MSLTATYEVQILVQNLLWRKAKTGSPKWAARFDCC